MQGIKEIIKGKILGDPDLVQQGRERNKWEKDVRLSPFISHYPRVLMTTGYTVQDAGYNPRANDEDGEREDGDGEGEDSERAPTTQPV
jgi:hypothetical protein